MLLLQLCCDLSPGFCPCSSEGINLGSRCGAGALSPSHRTVQAS